MKDTSIRRIQTLKLIPRAPHWITTSELVTKLEHLDYKISQRTIQRDLVDLSTVFPIECEIDGRTNCWRWSAKSEILDLPGMTPSTALSFFLAEQYLYEMLPPTATDALSPHFNKAREVLRESQSNRLDRWIDKVRPLPETLRLIPPKMKYDVVETTYTALLESTPFSATYRKRGDKKATYYEVINPLGLVFRNRVVYLVASLWEYNDPIQFALHRFVSIDLLDKQKIHRPKGFNLDQYIDAGHFDYIEGKNFKIELIFSSNIANHLEETPLAHDQVISKIDNNHVKVKATVANTDRLRWWIRGFGGDVEVIKPVSLRREFEEQAKSMADLYLHG